jgi:hypothetical protein
MGNDTEAGHKDTGDTGRPLRRGQRQAESRGEDEAARSKCIDPSGRVCSKLPTGGRYASSSSVRV